MSRTLVQSRSHEIRNILAIACLLFLNYPPPAVAGEPVLEHQVLPILTRKCMACHGGLIRKGELDLRSLPAMLNGGESGPAVVAGKPEASELWKRIADDEMPKGKEKLTAIEKGVIRSWIAAGLPTSPKHRSVTAASPEKHDPTRVSSEVDALIGRALAAAGSAPAPLADDAEFLRRVSLDLTGRIPLSGPAAAFLDDRSPEKRSKLVDALLSTPAFGEQFGRTWRDWICPPELPSDMNGGKQPHKEARELGDWLGRRVAAGDSWGRIVRDLLTAEGEIKNNPPIIFYGLVGQDAKATPEGTARSVASLFLGVQLQCAQCHDDPFRDWAQTDFWSLAAFFGQVTGTFAKVTEKPGEGRIVIPKTAFRNEGKKVPVAFLGAGGPDGSKPTAWRPVFADWLTARDNPYFARAFVNRLWFQFFGRGLVHPVDDFRELNPPSHPELLELLADEFRASGFDVKHLVRCLTTSQAYQRTSRPNPAKGRVESETHLRLFGRAPIRVMTADMLLDSLKLVYGDPKLDLRTPGKEDGNSNGESAAVGDPYLEFHRTFCTNEEDPTEFTHGIPQMLVFVNHPRLKSGSKALDEFIKRKPTFEQTVEWLYLATLSRRPSTQEMREMSQFAAATSAPATAAADVLWALINRTEFLCIR